MLGVIARLHRRSTVFLILALVATASALLSFSTSAFAAEPQRSVYYTYDLMGRQLSARFDSANGADGITNSYDGFGDLVSTTASLDGGSMTLTSSYDGGGRRTQLTHPDGEAFTYNYDALSRLSGVYQGAGTGTPLETFTYTNAGLPDTRSEGSGASSASYSWDDAGRLTGQLDVFRLNAGNVDRSFAYNPASQIVTETRDNDAYAWTGAVNVNRDYAVNGLNQYTSAGASAFAYDANGNLTSDGASSFAYDVENRLVKATYSTTTGSTVTNFTYDPLGRLAKIDRGTSGSTTYFVYDGDALVAELNGFGTITDRYIHGSNAAADDPLVWYEGSTLSNPRWLHADHLGSIVAVTDSSGGSPAINSYDEYGMPQTDAATHKINQNTGRFQYTGQAWIDQLGMYYYKARIYSPILGRFLQTDPVGYKGGINLYGYVMSDPVNLFDPDGRGPLGWIVRFTEEGIRKVRPFFSKAEGVAARRNEQNIITRNRQTSGQIERAANRTKQGVIRHSGHELADGKKGLPHFQSEGKRGHAFYGTLSAFGGAILTGLEFLDRATNPFDGSGLSECQDLGACASVPEQNVQLTDGRQYSMQPEKTQQWSIDAGQITGNRAQNTRIRCDQRETNVC